MAVGKIAMTFGRIRTDSNHHCTGLDTILVGIPKLHASLVQIAVPSLG